MIHEVDQLIKDLLEEGALTGSGVDVLFDAPTREWAARRNGPTVDAYLYDIREDVRLRERGTTSIRDTRGTVVRHRRPPRWFRLSYLVTAWTKRAEDEHRLLSAVLATLLPHEVLAPDRLPGQLAALGLSVPLSVAGVQNEARSAAEIWSALGGELKPSVDLVVTVPFPAFPEYDAAPTVTEGTVVRVRDTEGKLTGAPERRLRSARRGPGAPPPRGTDTAVTAGAAGTERRP